jgi:TonB family protein
MCTSASHEFLFSSLPRTRMPWTEFVFGTGMQAAALAGILWVRLLYPAVVTAPQHSFNSIQLVSTPVPVNHDPQPPLRMPVVVAHIHPPVPTIRPAAPKPRLVAKAVLEEAPVPTLSIAVKKPDPPLVTTAPVIPQEAVKVNVFSTGSSAPPTIVRPPAQVQTGGFGDPNGVAAKENHGKPVTVAAMGSFDLPSGAGYGNGTAGSKGMPAVVTSSGFGNGTAIADNSVHAQKAMVQPGGFGDADVPAAPTVHAEKMQVAARAVPAEILSKPTPLYTPEARTLHIEGEVLLEVNLQASGNLHVVRVVQGLGHGLDDNAVKAAEQIRFKPAMRNGQPADSTVVLHIIFQLA